MIWDQSFLRCSQILHFGLFGLPISSKGFLPTVVDIIVTWSKSPILVHFSSLIPEMSMFTLVISCLTTSNLPWFRDLTFQVPMQYYYLQHWTFLSPPETSTTGCCFCVSSASYFLLELFLLSSPVEYWTPTDLGSSSFIVISFCIFILFMGFSRQEHWSGLPVPPLEDCIFSELSHPPWVTLHIWLLASLNYTSPFATTRLCSMKGESCLSINKWHGLCFDNRRIPMEKIWSKRGLVEPAA